MSAGLWEFLRDAADSKQLHTAKAAEDGLAAAWLARDGLTGARLILEGAQGLAAGTSSDADPARLVDRLGTRWATPETSFKFHASCRHTHPAADALLEVVTRNDRAPDDIAEVIAHKAAIDVLGASAIFVLALFLFLAAVIGDRRATVYAVAGLTVLTVVLLALAGGLAVLGGVPLAVRTPVGTLPDLIPGVIQFPAGVGRDAPAGGPLPPSPS